ncbi:MAG: M14 family metallopeptidase [Kofleriaceae bacterium]
MPDLASLSRGFRSTYLDHATLTAQLHAWHAAFPDLTRLTSLGTTPEGRELWLLTLGVEPDRARPTAWVDGNMHASELAGSSVALAIAEDFLALLADPGHGDLPAPVRARLREVRLFVLPRMSPDGAEAVLTSGRYVRSVPRDDRAERGAPRWRASDVDGDGQTLVMRVEDPTGDYVANPDFPALMSARRLDDVGPFYRVYPEGTIDGWDGFTIPEPSFVGDNPVDLNRNFPWSWAPTHEQLGAGRFPTSEPESRAVVEFTSAHPEIFAWLNLHCYGGVFIRPLGHGPDSKMDQRDLAVFRQLEVWAKELTGYPVVSGFEEFLYAPDQPLHGDLTDYAYNQRGALAYVVELWDLFKRLELPAPKKFVDYYNNFDRAAATKLAAWDAATNHGRVVRPWRRFEHPQLGPVELGGLDPRIGVWNPPPELLPELCAQQAACFLRVAALAPEVVVRQLTVTPLGEDLSRVDVVVDNRGYLPTYVLASARQLEWNEPLYGELSVDGGALVEPDRVRVQLGHLAGWGRGVGVGADELAYLRSNGNAASARGSWLVRGAGTVRVRVGSTRVGFVEATASLG